MNKRELVEQVAARTGSKKNARAIVDVVFHAVQSAAMAGDKVQITGFGAFDLVHKPARAGRKAPKD